MTEKEIVIRIKRNQRVGVLIFAIMVPIVLIGMVFLFMPHDWRRTVGYPTLNRLLHIINTAILAISSTFCYNFRHENAS